MTTLPSPLPTPSSSRRTSTSSPSHSPSPARPANAQGARRNRAALRDYYGLKTSAPLAPSGLGIENDDASRSSSFREESYGDVKESDLDREGFDAEAYVRGVLGREGLEGVLSVEGGLVGEIKSLDGERKALVYDNYSKLITATDTIRKMRQNMDPLTPTTSTLAPAIAHIAETASALATSLHDHQNTPKIVSDHTGIYKDSMEERKRQQQTVRWVLGAPRRLRESVGKGERDVAERDWEEVKRLLERWRGVSGVEGVRAECERVMAGA